MRLNTFFIDLDDTVYPPSTGIWERIRERMSLYMQERLDIPPEEIPGLRRKFFETYGTTMRGLEVLYHIDTEDYLAFVHDVPIEDCLTPDPQLRQVLLSYPQRKLIFTNADCNHAERVLAALNLRDCFEQVIDIHHTSPACKPQPEAYHIALRVAGVDDPSSCLMADDSARNIETAASVGFFSVLIGSEETSPAAHASLPALRDLPTILPTN